MSGQRLFHLARIADLLRDQKLEALRAATARVAATEALIAGLAVQAAADLPALAEAKAALRYEGWAERRRRELAAILRAEQTELRKRQADAAQAFGRAQVIGRLRDRAGSQRSGLTVR